MLEHRLFYNSSFRDFLKTLDIDSLLMTWNELLTPGKLVALLFLGMICVSVLFQEMLRRERFYVAGRWIDQLSLGLTASVAVSAFIIKRDSILLLSARINQFATDPVLVIFGVGLFWFLIVQSLQAKLLLPRLSSFKAAVQWPPIYLAIAFGVLLLLATGEVDVENSEVGGWVLGTGLAGVLLPSISRWMVENWGPVKYRDEDFPIRSRAEDRMDRADLYEALADHWLVSEKPRSGAILGNFGTGKTSLAYLAHEESEERQPNRILVVYITFWGYSKREIVGYIVEKCETALSKHVDVSSLSGLGATINRSLEKPKGFLEVARTLFPGNLSLHSLDEMLAAIGKRLIIVLEDVDREYPVSEPTAQWAREDRSQLHQVYQLCEQIRDLRNLGIWFTLSPQVYELVFDAFQRSAPEIISLQDFDGGNDLSAMITRWYQDTELP